jgi:hypothetical protein
MSWCGCRHHRQITSCARQHLVQRFSPADFLCNGPAALGQELSKQAPGHGPEAHQWKQAQGPAGRAARRQGHRLGHLSSRSTQRAEPEAGPLLERSPGTESEQTGDLLTYSLTCPLANP